jgi:hypothetical protein
MPDINTVVADVAELMRSASILQSGAASLEYRLSWAAMVRCDSGTTMDIQTVPLADGTTNYSLSVQNATDARINSTGISSDPRERHGKSMN